MLICLVYSLRITQAIFYIVSERNSKAEIAAQEQMVFGMCRNSKIRLQLFAHPVVCNCHLTWGVSC